MDVPSQWSYLEPKSPNQNPPKYTQNHTHNSWFPGTKATRENRLSSNFKVVLKTRSKRVLQGMSTWGFWFCVRCHLRRLRRRFYRLFLTDHGPIPDWLRNLCAYHWLRTHRSFLLMGSVHLGGIKSEGIGLTDLELVLRMNVFLALSGWRTPGRTGELVRRRKVERRSIRNAFNLYIKIWDHQNSTSSKNHNSNFMNTLKTQNQLDLNKVLFIFYNCTLQYLMFLFLFKYMCVFDVTGGDFDKTFQSSLCFDFSFLVFRFLLNYNFGAFILPLFKSPKCRQRAKPFYKTLKHSK